MIFYFSGTGNTKWVASQIADAIGEELLYIPDLIRKGQYEYEWHEGERIGFCFPTHGWQPPGIVREFIRRLRVIRPPLTPPNSGGELKREPAIEGMSVLLLIYVKYACAYTTRDGDDDL